MNHNNKNITLDDSFLNGSFLYISLVQYLHARSDVIIGTVAIDLQRLNNQPNTYHTTAKYNNEEEQESSVFFSWGDFYCDELQPTVQLHNCPLRKNGLIKGYISCNISMIWNSKNDDWKFGEKKKTKKKKWYK